MALKDIKARDVMIKDPITISPDEKIALADLIMTRHSIGGLPVVEGERLVGIITQRDIMLARNYEIGGLKAGELMTRDPITVTPDTSLREVVDTMLENKIERLPVVEGKRVVGIVVHGGILQSIKEHL